MNNTLKLLFLSTFVGIVFSSNATLCPPTGPVFFAAPAVLLKLNDPLIAFEGYESTMTMQLKVAFSNIQNAVVDENMQITQSVLEASDLLTKNRTEVQRLSSELKMNHEAYLEQTAKREKASLLPTGGGEAGKSVNKEYFAKLCSLKKTSESAFGTSSRNASLKLEQSSLGKFEFSPRGALQIHVGKDLVNKHYDKYCTENDKKNGLCKDVAKIPNADLLAFLFLQPMNEEGKGVIKDLVMKTKYTYSDYEMEAAKNYIAHVVSNINLKKPPIGSDKNINNMPFITRYNQLEAMINMSRYAFSKAYNNRIPTINTKFIRLSRLDQIRMLIAKASSTDINAVTNANAKGKMIFVLNQMAIDNMLDQEISELEKLNNNLLAASLSEKNSSQNILNELNTRRIR